MKLRRRALAAPVSKTAHPLYTRTASGPAPSPLRRRRARQQMDLGAAAPTKGVSFMPGGPAGAGARAAGEQTSELICYVPPEQTLILTMFSCWSAECRVRVTLLFAPSAR